MYVCSGCPEESPDHTLRMAAAALDFADVVPLLREKTGAHFDIRIGMHVGPVVAGVVGLKDPR